MKTRTPRRVVREETPEEKALNAAIEHIYRKYGTNLTAFFRDVYKENRAGCQERGGTHDSPQSKL